MKAAAEVKARLREGPHQKPVAQAAAKDIHPETREFLRECEVESYRFEAGSNVLTACLSYIEGCLLFKQGAL